MTYDNTHIVYRLPLNVLLQIVGMVAVDFHTPGPALILSGVLTLIYIIPNDFDTLVNAFSFTTWLFHALVIASVLILRFTHKEYPRPFKVSIPVISKFGLLRIIFWPKKFQCVGYNST